MKTQIAAVFTISKMQGDGSIRYNMAGSDSDILGLIEFGKIIMGERMRANALQALATHAAGLANPTSPSEA